jgi:hypothetical protein
MTFKKPNTGVFHIRGGFYMSETMKGIYLGKGKNSSALIFDSYEKKEKHQMTLGRPGKGRAIKTESCKNKN